MTGNNIALLLTLLSAFIHPIWNMLLKRSDDKVIFYFNIHLFFTVLFSFVVFIYPLNNISSEGWNLVFLSSLAHFFYQIYLCRSYELADLSLTYPVIRSAPLFVAVLGVVFLGEKLSFIALVGIILTVLGAQMINLSNFSIKGLFDFKTYKHKRAIIAAALTAFFSALYSIVDKRGALSMPPVLFFYLFFAVSGLFFGLYLLLFKDKVKNYWAVTKKNKFNITAASILEFSSYILILYAFRLAHVAPVVAIRQISTVFGAMLGIMVLKEKYAKTRIIGSLIIFAGIYLLVIFKQL